MAAAQRLARRRATRGLTALTGLSLAQYMAPVGVQTGEVRAGEVHAIEAHVGEQCVREVAGIKLARERFAQVRNVPESWLI